MSTGRARKLFPGSFLTLPDFRAYGRVTLPMCAIVLCALVFQMLSGESFLTARNLSNLSRQVCVNLTLAIGMTLVILTSGIDLSVGSILGLSGMIAAITQVNFGLSQWGLGGAIVSFLSAVSVGGACGALTGFAISRVKITPFIVTLGMMVICRGLTLIVSEAQAVAPIGESLSRLSSDYLSPEKSVWVLGVAGAGILLFHVKMAIRGGGVWHAMSGAGLWLLPLYGLSLIFGGYRGIPYMVFMAALCAAGGALILKYFRFGRFVYAIGGNREAAELSGVPVSRALWLTYFIMGLLSGLAGVMDVARVNGAVPSAGELAELDAIAAVVIGGTSLMGGVGTISGTLLGVLIMGVLNNGLSLIGVSEHYQKVFKGLVIIFAVYLDLKAKSK